MIRPNPPLMACVLFASALTAGLAHAGTVSLDGQPVTVTLLESGFPDAVDTVTAGPGGPQILGNTASDPIGSILFSNESVDLQNLQIVYRIQGGGGAYGGTAPQCSGSPGCSLWSATPDDARFLFSGLSFGVPGEILGGVNLTTSNVFGVQVADITPTSFEVIFGSAGVLNGTGGNPALGTITLNLVTEMAPVPLPPSVAMLLGGLALLALGKLRQRTLANAVGS